MELQAVKLITDAAQTTLTRVAPIADGDLNDVTDNCQFTDDGGWRDACKPLIAERGDILL